MPGWSIINVNELFVNLQLIGLPGEADSMQLGPHQAETWSDNQHCLCNNQHDSVFLISESIFIKRSGKIQETECVTLTE